MQQNDRGVADFSTAFRARQASIQRDDATLSDPPNFSSLRFRSFGKPSPILSYLSSSPYQRDDATLSGLPTISSLWLLLDTMVSAGHDPLGPKRCSNPVQPTSHLISLVPLFRQASTHPPTRGTKKMMPPCPTHLTSHLFGSALSNPLLRFITSGPGHDYTKCHTKEMLQS